MGIERKPKLLVPLIVVVAGVAAVVWWMQGGFGGPVSDSEKVEWLLFDRDDGCLCDWLVEQRS